jgi:hypothetical protein
LVPLVRHFCYVGVKNRTLEEIDEMFEARLPARKFRTYVSRGRVDLDAEARKSIEKEKEVSVMKSEMVAAETGATKD